MSGWWNFEIKKHRNIFFIIIRSTKLSVFHHLVLWLQIFSTLTQILWNPHALIQNQQLEVLMLKAISAHNSLLMLRVTWNLWTWLICLNLIILHAKALRISLIYKLTIQTRGQDDLWYHYNRKYLYQLKTQKILSARVMSIFNKLGRAPYQILCLDSLIWTWPTKILRHFLSSSLGFNKFQQI